MLPPPDLQTNIAETEGLIARAEERLLKLEAKAEPGAARIVHTLTNSIRKYRRELQKLLARHADTTKQKDQLLQQKSQMKQRDAAADRSGELPAKQDQEARKPASQQGVVAGQ